MDSTPEEQFAEPMDHEAEHAQVPTPPAARARRGRRGRPVGAAGARRAPVRRNPRGTTRRSAIVPGTAALATLPHAAGVALVVISVEDLVTVVEAAVRRAIEANHAIEPADWLTAEGAAKLLDVHPRTVGKLANTGELPSARIGKLFRFRRCDVIAFLENRIG